MRVLLSVSLALEVLSGILLDTPSPLPRHPGQHRPARARSRASSARATCSASPPSSPLITFLVEYRTQSVRTGVSLYSVVLGGASPCSPTPPPSSCSRSRVGVAAGALALVRHARRRGGPPLQWTLAGAAGRGHRRGLCREASDHRLARRGHATSRRARTCGTTLLNFVRMHPVQGWGWFGPWAPSEIPVHLDQLPAPARPRARRSTPTSTCCCSSAGSASLFFLALGGLRLRPLVARRQRAPLDHLRVDAAHPRHAPRRLDVRELHAVGLRLAAARALRGARRPVEVVARADGAARAAARSCRTWPTSASSSCDCQGPAQSGPR